MVLSPLETGFLWTESLQTDTQTSPAVQCRPVKEVLWEVSSKRGALHTGHDSLVPGWVMLLWSGEQRSKNCAP